MTSLPRSPADRLSGARKPGRVLRNLWAPRRLPDASPTPGAALVDVAYVADVAPLLGVGCSSVRYRPHGSERSSARYPLNMPPEYAAIFTDVPRLDVVLLEFFGVV